MFENFAVFFFFFLILDLQGFPKLYFMCMVCLLFICLYFCLARVPGICRGYNRILSLQGMELYMVVGGVGTRD